MTTQRKFIHAGPVNRELQSYVHSSAANIASSRRSGVLIQYDETVGGIVQGLDEYMASRGYAFDPSGGTVNDGASVPGAISALGLSFTSVSTATVGRGSCRADNNIDNIVSSGALIANIASAGANGLDTGAEAANTWYAVWLIGDPTGMNPVASLLSASFTAPTFPMGYTVKRRIGAVRNNGSSDFIPFVQRWKGQTRRYWYETARAELQVLTGGSAIAFTAVPLGSLIPPSSQNALLFWSFEIPEVTGNVTDEFELRRTGSAVADGPLAVRPGILTPGSSMRGQGEVPTSAAQSIDYLVSDADDNLDLYVAGFDDEL